MPHMPTLRVVPLESIRRHEEIDPLRVARLSERIETDAMQVNPMVCVEGAGGLLVLLDGATRTESLKRIGLSHAVVQIVDPATVTLGTWHHVVRGCPSSELLDAVTGVAALTLVGEEGTPRIVPREGPVHHVVGHGLSANQALSALVAGYLGRWNVSRVTDPAPSHVGASFPDWAAVVEFPTLTVEDVMSAALSDDPLPAGITRFQVPERALRLNIPLPLLEGDATMEEKQAALDAVLAQRANEGRIRRYEEPVFVLDD
jgi:L-serine kinase (ATP) / ParB family transcriptional regulator, heme-responsive regulator